ncbi:DsrH/TusB family sulfur metabolism protein [Zhongshania sp. BJYM1]|jgi:sulfur relay protein TusB/DsrH|uniref:DsrH/TusB family sulfur metabolism protein n=1 Tax=Zhongshania aquatica TaxID=2965069 RepID=UPI0022B4ADB8|nr:DsrH/TusB family sulfur metabolism protein [Marortus sp. BJYM1]
MHLHILNSPASYDRCKSSLSDTDAIILIEDAVTLSPSILGSTGQDIAFYALRDDLLRRGITPNQKINLLDFPEFVDLCVAHPQCISW